MARGPRPPRRWGRAADGRGHARIPEVVIRDILSGDFDIVVRLEAASLERVRGIWEDIAQMPGVRDTVTALTLSGVVNRPRGARSSTEPG
ncbi:MULTISPECIES: Lrp/AsnC ligand binding domain-containing protein [unclassified Streptomyces]|uniref:Lrp/AsnC ligand binding domain-containing protein n=1 Tax=unclassified Streptomyces TaxID=2593676 RepID=UPI0027E343E0|nr:MULTISPECIES: Lrp/AsnC ligand binding domain-containing protein [unclassified Streptomyces]